MAAAASLTFKDVTGKYASADDIDENSICIYHSTYRPLGNVNGNIGAVLTINGYDIRYKYQLQFITVGDGITLYCRGKYEGQWKNWIKIV